MTDKVGFPIEGEGRQPLMSLRGI